MSDKYVVNQSKPHLGGNFAEGDPACWCPSAWKYIFNKYSIKTAMDIGSGCGHAAKFFSDQGIKTTAIEGLEDNVVNSIYPTVLHDLTTGPYKKEVDFTNCIEVVEHIEEKFIENLMTTLCQGNYVLITHAVPKQRGWHHVNCQPSEYWIEHFTKRDYNLLKEDSEIIRELANQDGGKHIARNGMLFKKN